MKKRTLNVVKLLTCGIIVSSLISCNSGSSSSVNITGPYTQTPDGTESTSSCQFNNTINTICTITLSYTSSPAASLSTSGVSAPYSIQSNSCTASSSSANCAVVVSYQPKTTPSSQTLSLSVNGETATVTLSNQ